jgi:uncharacterized protein (TIGR03000 family)
MNAGSLFEGLQIPHSCRNDGRHAREEPYTANTFSSRRIPMQGLMPPRFVLAAFVAAIVMVFAASGQTVGQSGTRYIPAPPRELPVVLIIRVPAQALVDIEGVRTRSTGDVRRFQSPPLPVDQSFIYNVKATWKAGDQEIVREHKATVRGGDEVTVDLRQEPAPKDKPKP